MNSLDIRRPVSRALALISLLSLGLCSAVAAERQTLFSTPEDAVTALVNAAKAKDQAALTAIFGPDRERLLSGDPVEDASALEHFAANLERFAKLQKVDDTRFTLLLGADQWPFPIPIVKEGNLWRFDTAAGLEEILNRRIGENELSAIMTCRAYVVAQWEYFTESRDTAPEGLAVYAQRFISTPGKRDGLYWDTAEGGRPSPLGSLVTEARAEGYAPGRARSGGGAEGAPAPKRSPYHGYYFRILKRQGPHAPGGAFSYIINGNMIAGYALVAYPDKWGSSGIMTFIVNQQGRVYQKNLGPTTAEIAAAMTEYDPDPAWTLVKEP
ncbi:MAG: DUF2950 domain-containing protein [Bryobacteraceae bacterium]